VNNLPKVVTQHRRGRASNPRLLDRKSDALPLATAPPFIIHKKRCELTKVKLIWAFESYVQLDKKHKRYLTDDLNILQVLS